MNISINAHPSISEESTASGTDDAKIEAGIPLNICGPESPANLTFLMMVAAINGVPESAMDALFIGNPGCSFRTDDLPSLRSSYGFVQCSSCLLNLVFTTSHSPRRFRGKCVLYAYVLHSKQDWLRGVDG